MEIIDTKRGRPLKAGEKADKVMRVSETTTLEEYSIKPNSEFYHSYQV